jgi:HTH-type transcriptional regulator / antitoxin HigA
MKIAPIRSDEMYEAALSRVSALMARVDEKSLDELEILQALIERWERDRYQVMAPTPVEAIRFRMGQDRLRPRDLEPYIGPRSRVSEVLSGRRPLSIDMIRALHKHLGIPIASLVGKEQPDPRTTPKPSNAALTKLMNLGILKAKEDFTNFLANAFKNHSCAAMLRKSRTLRTNARTDFAALEAWCAAVLLKAGDRRPHKMKEKVRPEFGRELAQLSVNPNGPALAEKALARAGILFVTLDHLPGTFLDGAAMCRHDGTPIIALTLRHDRVDNFWFTLLHEFAHVCHHLNDNTTIILDDLEVKSSVGIEDEADAFAQAALIPPTLWSQMASPDLGPEDVIRIAAQARVHPAIIAGRWQREFGDYRRFSKMLGRGEVRMQFTAGRD